MANEEGSGESIPTPKPKFKCPKPGKPMKLRGIIKKMATNRAFAEFIRDLLCKAREGDAAAGKCLDSYYKAEETEINSLCLSDEDRKACLRCTDQWKLLAASTFAFSDDDDVDE